MNFVVHTISLAEADVAEAAIWYERQTPGVGSDFLGETEAALDRLKHEALLYAVRFEDVRCLRLRRSRACGVHYLIQGNEV